MIHDARRLREMALASRRSDVTPAPESVLAFAAPCDAAIEATELSRTLLANTRALVLGLAVSRNPVDAWLGMTAAAEVFWRETEDSTERLSRIWRRYCGAFAREAAAHPSVLFTGQAIR